MNKSLVIAVVQAVTKQPENNDHKITTSMGKVFYAQEDCSGVAALKRGVLAIFYLKQASPPQSRMASSAFKSALSAPWYASQMTLYPTEKDISQALLTFGK